MGIKVVAFDLDDTLWDMQPTLARAERKLIEWLKHNCRDLDYDPEVMLELRSTLIAEQPSLKTQISELRKQTIYQALLTCGYGERAAYSSAVSAFEVFLAARNQVFFFADAIESLQALHEQYTLGALTNGNADIQRLGLERYFAFAFSAEQVGAPKPAIDLFSAALAHTNVEPNEMIYVGDNPELDIAAAQGVGLSTIWVNIDGRLDVHCEPDQTITRLSELPSAVDQIDQRLMT